MNILIWSQHFWPENFRINELAIELVRQQDNVTVLTGKPNYPLGKIVDGYKASGVLHEQVDKVDVVRVPLIPRGKGSSIQLFFNYLSFILSGYFIAPFVLRKKAFDVVFVYATSPLLQALPAIFIARLKKIPLIVWVQDLWPDALLATGFIKNRWVLKLVGRLVRYIYTHANIIMVQSEGFRSSIEALVGNKKQILFYPNSSEDMTNFLGCSRSLSQVALEIQAYFSIVFTGNIGTVQSCETIIQAAEILKGHAAIKIYLVGGGSSFAKIDAEVKMKKITNVTMTGQLPSEEMPAIFAAASVLLLSLKDSPSLSATIPSKLQSYLSAKKPIIGSLNGEAARIILEANAGICCPAEDPNALAEAILSLYQKTHAERLHYGVCAYQYFKTHFDVTNKVRELKKHLGSIKAT